jgi:RecA-family ATPase
MSKELTIGAPLQLKNEVVKAEVKGKSLFPLVSASTMTDKPVQIEWLVENFLEQGSLNLLFGEPASGKSLFALDWAFCMTAGMDWHGYQTKQIDVVIIAGEGFAGMKRRLKALEGKY